MTPEERKELVRRAYEQVFTGGDLAAADVYFGPDFVNRAGPPDWPSGPESIRRTVTMLRTALPDMRYTVESVIVEGETIAARWTARGTHNGELRAPFGVIPPTGQPIEFHGVTYGRIGEDGKAGESWIFTDVAQQFAQLARVAEARGR